MKKLQKFAPNFNRRTDTFVKPDETHDKSPLRESKKYEISIRPFIYTISQCLDSIGKSTSDPVNTADILLHIVHGGDRKLIDQYCTGHFIFDPYRYELVFPYGKTFNPKVDTELFSNFMNEMLTRIQNGCRYNSIAFSLVIMEDHNTRSGHRNMLFTYRQSDNDIVMVLYEPHGSRIENKALHQQRDNLFLDMVNYAKTKDISINFLPPISINCYLGAQASGDDSPGLCVTYSNFWLFCLFTLIKENPELPDNNFPKMLAGIEPAILANHRELFDNLMVFIVLEFGGFLLYANDRNEIEQQITPHFLRLLENYDFNSIKLIEQNTQEKSGPNLQFLIKESENILHEFNIDTKDPKDFPLPDDFEETEGETFGNWQMRRVKSQIRFVNLKTGEVSSVAPDDFVMQKYNSIPKQRGDWIECWKYDFTTYYKNLRTREVTVLVPYEFSNDGRRVQNWESMVLTS